MNCTINSMDQCDRSGVLLGVKWSVSTGVIDTQRSAQINSVQEVLNAIIEHRRILNQQTEQT